MTEAMVIALCAAVMVAFGAAGWCCLSVSRFFVRSQAQAQETERAHVGLIRDLTSRVMAVTKPVEFTRYAATRGPMADVPPPVKNHAEVNGDDGASLRERALMRAKILEEARLERQQQNGATMGIPDDLGADQVEP
jgi:hypothetical protein